MSETHDEPLSEVKFTDADYERDYEVKKDALERVLGPMYHLVCHAIFPYQMGGALDMYLFPHGIPGTGFASMELLEPDGSGPKPNGIGTFELVAFTRLSIPAIEAGRNSATASVFTHIQSRLNGIMTMTGQYSTMAVLNPGDTCEVPWKDGEPNVCLVLDNYDPNGTPFMINGRTHCLLLCMEIFPEEMAYARAHRSAALLDKLKAAGVYPYSDMDRKSVV
jgi:hypothetical protein